jgi:hypothetical protein
MNALLGNLRPVTEAKTDLSVAVAAPFSSDPPMENRPCYAAPRNRLLARRQPCVGRAEPSLRQPLLKRYGIAEGQVCRQLALGHIHGRVCRRLSVPSVLIRTSSAVSAAGADPGKKGSTNVEAGAL